ncbi:hypothetical protein BJ165DRAFT_1354706 [Panaeolus papilionaceus]|nr:hypothetical protein BJ165DRAFT_1354706 [Panaeolus papilionaceus]
MCYREVQCTRHVCGHDHPQTDIRVDCRSPACRYSQLHGTSCQPITCGKTCFQWLKPARNIVAGQSPTPCGYCRGVSQ